MVGEFFRELIDHVRLKLEDRRFRKLMKRVSKCVRSDTICPQCRRGVMKYYEQAHDGPIYWECINCGHKWR